MKFSIGKMCKIFQIGVSSYYDWQQRGSSKRWQENEDLLKKIQEIFVLSHKTYGSPRITEELHSEGEKVSRPRVARIMRAAGIRAGKPRKFAGTTDSRHNYPIVPHILNRNFRATRKGEIWVSDLTYVMTKSGWLYLTVIIDLYDRKVVGWSMSKGFSAEETIIPAWMMAVINRPITGELIFHSDRGVQYACKAFTNILNSNNLITRSMSRKGNCWDNAVAESFFKSIKVEWIYNNEYQNQAVAQLSIFEWIESWYNHHRRHSALGYKTIDEFDKKNANFKCVA